MKPEINTKPKNESLLFLLLSHHRTDKLHRTIHMRISHHDLYLCARGVGRYSGLIAAFIMSSYYHFPLWLYPFSFVFFPLPATMDWGTQKIGLRESQNSVRVFTGFLLGAGQGLLIISFLKGMASTTRFGVGVMIVYFLCFCVAKYWKRGGKGE